MALSNKFVLNSFKDSLNNMHNFFNPFSKGISYIIFSLGNNSFNFFDYSDNLCGICYNNYIIPSYVDPCKHKFCLCCIIRWINHNNKCPMCRCSISNIFYVDAKAKGKQAIIETKTFFNNGIINSSNQNDSKFCVICKECNNENQLLLCSICRFNLTHLKCAGINDNHVSEFICFSCRENL